MNNKTFYELNPNAAKALVAKQVFDGWTQDEIKEYFYNLGCGIFFVRDLVNPFFINSQDNNQPN